MGRPRHFARNLKRLVADPARCLIPERQDVAGMWLECGAIALAADRMISNPAASALTFCSAEIAFGADFWGFLIDRAKGQTLYTALTTGCPPSLQGAKARRRSISLFIVKAASEVDRKPSASTAIKEDFPAYRGVEAGRLPGCLKIESEERETWTAESLRAASSWKGNLLRRAAGRETSAVHV